MRKISVKNKCLIAQCIISVATITIIIVINCLILLSNIRENAIKDNEYYLKNTLSNITEYLNLIESNLVSNFDKIYESLNNYYQSDELQKFLDRYKLEYELKNIKSCVKNIESVSFISDKFTINTGNSPAFTYDYDYLKSNYVNDKELVSLISSDFDLLLKKDYYDLEILPALFKAYDYYIVLNINFYNEFFNIDNEIDTFFLCHGKKLNIGNKISYQFLSQLLLTENYGKDYYENYYIDYSPVTASTYMISLVKIDNITSNFDVFLTETIMLTAVLISIDLIAGYFFVKKIFSLLYQFKQHLSDTKTLSTFEIPQYSNALWHNLPIAKKIIVYFILFSIVPILIINTYFLIRMPAVHTKSIEDSYALFAKQAAQNIDYKLNIFKTKIDTLILSNSVQYYFIAENNLLVQENEDEGSLNYIQPSTEIGNLYNINKDISNYDIYAYADNLILYDNDGNILFPQNILSDDFRHNEKWFINKFINYTLPVLSSHLTIEQDETFLNAIAYRPLGYIRLIFSKEKFSHIFTVFDNEINTLCYITDNENNILSCVDTSKIGMNETDAGLYNSASDLKFTSSIKSDELFFNYVVKKTETYKKSNILYLSNILLLSFILFFSVIFAILLSKSLVKDIHILQKNLSSISNLNEEIKFNTESNEIKALIDTFNDMMKRVKTLTMEINQKKLEFEKLEKLKKEADLIAHQTQIDPHFIYNVFASISILIRLKKNAQAEKMLNAVSNMLKLSLYRNVSIVPLSEEVEHLKAYINIQKIRFEDKIKFHLNIDENLMNIKILKLILQPLVENAIKHGLEPQNGGEIFIDIYKKDDRLIYSVKDTGIGFTEEKLNKIKSNMLNNDFSNHLGLININQRLNLNYGKNYTLDIESAENKGTTITLSLPINNN